MIVLDHIAVLCERLEQGVAHVEAALGVRPEGGGRHEAFATHNRLLGLGEDTYLEVIAIDPDAPAPGRARWFDLDRFSGPPKLARWICRCDDLAGALARHPGAGEAMDLARGDYRWSMAVPRDGVLPSDNLHPALMQWHGPHPAPVLPDHGLRLERLLVGGDGPEVDDARVVFDPETRGIAARIMTPDGPKWLR